MTTLTARRFDTGEAIQIQFLGNQVASIFPASVSVAELESLPFIAPGLFDIQLNGFNGIWFGSEQLTVAQVEQVIHDYLKQGITRCFPMLCEKSSWDAMWRAHLFPPSMGRAEHIRWFTFAPPVLPNFDAGRMRPEVLSSLSLWHRKARERLNSSARFRRRVWSLRLATRERRVLKFDRPSTVVLDWEHIWATAVPGWCLDMTTCSGPSWPMIA
jgi:hypothetical protein